MTAPIEKFKVNGKVYIWKFIDNQRNYPGWNLTVDLKASKNLSELLDLMNDSEWPSKKTISTELPTKSQLKVPNNRGGLAKWKSKPKLTLNYKKGESDNYWLITETDNGVVIQFGKAKFEELKNAINGIPKGVGDYAISDPEDKNVLYFWWNS
jgi:hypothetical protein